MFVVKENLVSNIILHMYQVMKNDADRKQIFGNLWLPNRLGEFFSTETFRYLNWENIVIGKLKLRLRTIPEPLQKAKLTFPGGVM
jgi:hypothetical protein